MSGRIWDRYLTEHDQAYLERIERRPVGFGERSTLLLIDLYRKVFGDKPEPLLESIKTWPKSKGMAGWLALPHIQTLLSAARKAGIPIIHSTGLDLPEANQWRGGRSVLRSSENPTSEALERYRRQYDIIDEVAPLHGEAVIRKATPSVFLGTPFVGYLNSLGIDTVITCGETTSGCVRATVVDGYSYRFRMIVVEECVFDRHEIAHAINLWDMNRKYADVLPLAEVLQYMGSEALRRAAH